MTAAAIRVWLTWHPGPVGVHADILTAHLHDRDPWARKATIGTTDRHHAPMIGATVRWSIDGQAWTALVLDEADMPADSRWPAAFIVANIRRETP